MIDTAAVLAWGVPRLRDLPWRRTRDPWRVLVAEVMLQQTQVERVVPKWEAFLSAYPSPAACARAPLGDVLRLWQGLGYPRRARNLHDAASVMLERHGGRVPDELAALVALPGIGPYTARAVLAFAYERDVAVVDTNIARVLARSVGRRLTAADAQAAADRLVPAGAGWVWNQTLMDLGATVCRPAPRCDACPIGLGCRWHLGANAATRSGARVGRREHGAASLRGKRPSGAWPGPGDAHARAGATGDVRAAHRRRARRRPAGDARR